MDFQLLPILTLLISLVAVASHADQSPEAYWNSVLPNTPMPKAVRDLLPTGLAEDKSTSVQVGNGGVNVDTGKGKSSGGTSVNVRRKGVGVNTGKPAGGPGTHVGVGKKGVSVGTGHPGRKPVHVRVNPGSPFLYSYAATQDQLHDDPNVAVFFLEKDMTKGTEMNLHFTKTTDESATFLPRQDAEKIPFSSEEFPEILNRFSLSPESTEAKIMKKSIDECELAGIKGEEKYCATSLESMVDFSTSKLGKNAKAISTEADKYNDKMEKYRVEEVKKVEEGSEEAKAVVCHKQNYPYAVFYCHKTDTTKPYVVSLRGSDGAKVEAVAVCHTDTSAWNPKHLAFQVLKVEPGTVPVCHFLPEDHIVWVPNN